MNPIARYHHAIADKLNSDKKSKIENDKDIQEAIYEILNAYAQGEIKVLPKDVVLQMANSIRDLNTETGQSKTQRKSINKNKSSTDIECIKDGVKYIQWVKAGLIKDKSYNRTVREAFNVTSGTVRAWASNSNYQSKLPSAKLVTDEERESVKKLITFSGNFYRHSSS